MPRGQSKRTSSARTSQAAPKPYVTTRARVSPLIHITFGSSPLSTAIPCEGNARTIQAFSSRVTSRAPRLRWCSLPIEVTTVISGRTTLA